jgi:imidazole glycerol phosphate synthase subunit HisF
MNRKVVVLQVKNRELYKTCGRGIMQYIGDPVNALSHFSSFEAHEILLMDISDSQMPDYELLQLLGKHCDMPLTYAGKMRDLKSVHKVLRLGFERVCIGDYYHHDPEFIRRLVMEFGSSTISILCNYVISNGERLSWQKDCRTNNVINKKYLNDLSNTGVGEVILYNISSDGKRSGFDTEILSDLSDMTNWTLCGGAESINEVNSMLASYPLVSFASGSAFTLLKNNSVFLKYKKEL